MKLVFLGTGSGFPSRERNVSALALQINGEVLLFDCGEGTQRQLMFSSLSFMKVRRIFISHFHGDHFLGVGGLVQSMCLNNRTAPLDIYGPEGALHFIGEFLRLGYFNQTMPVLIHEIGGGESIDFGKYFIRTLTVEHGGIPALAYSLEEPERGGKFLRERAVELGVQPGPDFRRLQQGESVKVGKRIVSPEMVIGPPRRGRKVVYSGDTRPLDAMVDFARDADVLIHEATFHSGLAERAEEFGHSTAKRAAEIAKRANVGKLYLTHFSHRYSEDPTPLLEEAKAVFSDTELARDFLEYDVMLRD